jgi:hypothetical protein
MTEKSGLIVIIIFFVIGLFLCSNVLGYYTNPFPGQKIEGLHSTNMSPYFFLAYHFNDNNSIQGAAALLDVDADGFLDIALVSSTKLYFIQNNGDNTFTEYDTIQSKNGVGWGMHDFNQDGCMDLYSAQENQPDVMINNADGTFTSLDLGNEGLGIVRTALFADFNNDNYIDSYISCSNFRTNHYWNQMHPGLSDGSFGDSIIDEILDPPIPDFWHKWAHAPWGLKGEWSNKQFKGAVVRDFDDDGYPDIVTCAYADAGYQDPRCIFFSTLRAHLLPRGVYFLHNLADPNNIRFEEIGRQAFGENSQGDTRSFWNPYHATPLDYDLDGDLDLFMGATIRRELLRFLGWENTDVARFYENQCEPGVIKFIDRTAETGFSLLNDLSPEQRSGRNLAAAAQVDFDNDGWVDLAVVNRRDAKKTPYAYVHLFRNMGDGTFKEIEPSLHGLTEFGGGSDIVSGDLNNDGKPDLVITGGSSLDSQDISTSRVYINTIDTDNHWVQLKILDNATKTYVIGAKVSVYESGTQRLLGYDEVRTDFSYRSKREPILHFGLGLVDAVDVKVKTQHGDVYEFKTIGADEAYDLFLEVL